MNYTTFTNFLTCYSLPTLAISVIVTLIYECLDKIFSNSLPAKIKTYLPTLLAIVLQLLYHAIFLSEEFVFDLDGVYTGILSGSIATIFIVFINKLKSGKLTTTEAICLLIEGIIRGFVPNGELNDISKDICDLIANNTNLDDIADKITQILLGAENINLSTAKLDKLVKKILKSVKTVNK